eukprot:TRINITY_DN704_c0_g1_i3.p1 TRINITY_DN704_c0_g1~~TRINITY_DN704_c0_g1_i3.p1  ORF type:complete len:123 (-),score=4.61 TRINITY_DN704_c0_g1_i3:20-388(-)
MDARRGHAVRVERASDLSAGRHPPPRLPLGAGGLDVGFHIGKEFVSNFGEIVHVQCAVVHSPRVLSTTSDIKASKATLCLLYTSDAADEEDSVDLGGRRIIKKKKKIKRIRLNIVSHYKLKP